MPRAVALTRRRAIRGGRLGATVAASVACLLALPAAAALVTPTDVVVPLPSGGSNVLVIFDELATNPATMTPITHRGVTYTTVAGMSVVIGKDPTWPIGPTTRFVDTPMLATVIGVDPSGIDDIILRLDFATPTPWFGFGFGFNDFAQPQDGSLTGRVGTVELFNGGSSTPFASYDLNASRLYCCTENRFDYSNAVTGAGYVQQALITFDYDYTPFSPADGQPGQDVPKFFGLDNVSYFVPLPPALWLLGSALGLFGVWRRRTS